MYERLVGVRGQLAELVTAVDPDAVSGSTARQCWAEFDRIERLAAAGKTLLARRVADTHRPDRSGSKTPAEDLARKAGSTTGSAKDAMDTSQRLPEQPELDRALRRGQLSPAQAGLISAAAAADPAAERRLTELAGQVSLAELRAECARVRAAADPDPEATNRRLHADRRLRRWTDSEGFWNLHAKGTPQAGALFNTVLDPIIDRIFKTARTQGRREHPDAYALDALIHLAEHAAGHCDCDQPNQPAGDAGDGDADTAKTAADRRDTASHADTGRGDPTGRDTAAADTTEAARADAAGTETAGRDEAAQTDAAGPCADGVDADAGLDGAASRDAEPATPTSGQRMTDTAGRTGPAADPVRTNGPATGDPGIFAAPAGATGSVGSTGPGCAAQPSTNWRYLALLRVDVQALRRGQVAGEELCEIAGVGSVPISVAKGMLGEAILKLVITNGVDVANVTHLGRGPTAAQRAALLWTNPTCSVQGCPRHRIEYDHQKPWAQTKHTRLDELDPLCGFHHDLKTRLHWALVPGTGKRAFVAPDDPRHPRYRMPRANPSGGQAARPWAVRDTTRPWTASAAPAAAGKAGSHRAARRVAAAQMTLPEPPAVQAPQPP